MNTTPGATVERAAQARPVRGHVYAVAAAFLSLMAYSAIPTPLYAIYARRDGFGPLTTTVIFSAYAVGVMVSLWAAGHLSDVLGRRRVLLAAIGLASASAPAFLLWPSVPGLLVGRLVNGLAIGVATATATAWSAELSELSELHADALPGSPARGAQRTALVANIGGLGVGPLVAGALAEWGPAPLVVPYLVAVAALAVSGLAILRVPETRPALRPRPPYHPQHTAIPRQARATFAAAGTGAVASFAVYGLFNAITPGVLSGTLHQHSHALAGAAAFLTFAGGVGAQLAADGRGTPRIVLRTGLAFLVAGLATITIAVWVPSLALFLLGGMLAGAGAGLVFRSALALAVELAPPTHRAEVLAGLYLVAYLGISVPVIGLALLTQFIDTRVALAVFAGLLAAGSLIAGRRLLSRPEQDAAGRPRTADAANPAGRDDLEGAGTGSSPVGVTAPR